MVLGLVELCKLIWTNLNLTLESQVTSLPTDQPNYWILLNKGEMNGSGEMITTVH